MPQQIIIFFSLIFSCFYFVLGSESVRREELSRKMFKFFRYFFPVLFYFRILIRIYQQESYNRIHNNDALVNRHRCNIQCNRMAKKCCPIFTKISPVLYQCTWNSNPLEFLWNIFCFKDRAFSLVFAFFNSAQKYFMYRSIPLCTFQFRLVF